MNLSSLITVHKGDRSYDTLAADCGGAPSGKRLQQIATSDIRNFPDPETIEALSRGLRVTESVVVLAAAESLGLDVANSMPRLVQLLPAAAAELTEEQAAAIAHLVRTVTRPAAAAGSPERVMVDGVPPADQKPPTERQLRQWIVEAEQTRGELAAIKRPSAEIRQALEDKDAELAWLHTTLEGAGRDNGSADRSA